MIRATVFVWLVVLALAGDVRVGSGRSAAAVSGCAQLGKLKSVLPTAGAAGLTERLPIKVERARAPVWPGRCGAFWTTYKGDRRTVDVTVTLYKTSQDVNAALAEPLFGPTHVLANGARVRTNGPSPGAIGGLASSSTSAMSAFRNLFISSTSIVTSRPVSVSAQLRIHRLIENAFTLPRAAACPATPGYSIDELRSLRKYHQIRENLWGNICGPTRVTPGVNYNFTVVITNISDTTYHPFTLDLSHYEPLVRSSRPYRREPAANGDPKMKGAAWTTTRLKPGQSLHISFTLPFTRHPDPKASNFDVQVFLPGLLYWEHTYDVSFAKRP